MVQGLQVPVVPQQPPYGAHSHLELSLICLSDCPGGGEPLLVLDTDAPHMAQRLNICSQPAVILCSDLQGLVVLVPPCLLPAVYDIF